MIQTAKEFGLALRQQRQAIGMTQDALAARCGVTRRTIIDLEAGKSGTRLGKALMAAAEVGLTLSANAVPVLDQCAAPLADDDPFLALLGRVSDRRA